ncbi:MAG: MgtC/SapB family protein [Bdellovibrionales bacterium]|nr:MgtC/SapB family protein [Bdellovibrionales bacterium]
MNPNYPLNPQDWSNTHLLLYFGIKAILAVACGGIVGLERELKSKPAGLKTNILICLGSAMFTTCSVLISNANGPGGFAGDPSRVAAQIVSGIGFLGGGVIIQARGGVVGLTTAATIWMVSALGVIIGLGFHNIALFVAAIVILILVSVSWFEDRVLGRSLTFHTEIVAADPEGETRATINALLAENDLVLESFDIEERSGGVGVMQIRYTGHREDQKKFNLSLWSTSGVKEIRQH